MSFFCLASLSAQWAQRFSAEQSMVQEKHFLPLILHGHNVQWLKFQVKTLSLSQQSAQCSLWLTQDWFGQWTPHLSSWVGGTLLSFSASYHSLLPWKICKAWLKRKKVFFWNFTSFAPTEKADNILNSVFVQNIEINFEVCFTLFFGNMFYSIPRRVSPVQIAHLISHFLIPA